MKHSLLLTLLLLALSCSSQNIEKYNFGLEKLSTNRTLPYGWFSWGDEVLSIDSLVVHSGQYAGKISINKSNQLGVLAYKIPANYTGKTITLESYIKSKNVQTGEVDMFIRITGDGGNLVFQSLEEEIPSGTNDWKKYQITADFPEDAETIYIAGRLMGKGTAWFDDFKLLIDHQPIENLKEVKKTYAKAKLDKAYDQGSAISISHLNQDKIQSLALFGKVWGFLKYHHPSIAQGDYQWDYELFRLLPIYIEDASPKERANLLVQWIQNLGKVPICKTCEPAKEDAYLKPDLSWIQDQPMALKETLNYIYQHRAQGKQYYISQATDAGNPVFKHEKAYAQLPYPDDGFRLLALYRFWNIIQYYYPYKHLIEKNWDDVLTAYIPVFLNTSDELAYELAVTQLIGEIHDTHTTLSQGNDQIKAWKGLNYPPVHTQFIQNQLLVVDYYNPEMQEMVGLEVGDVITHINGKEVKDIVLQKSKYYPASNQAARLRDMSQDLLRSNQKYINIAYKSEDLKIREKKLLLYPQDSLGYYTWYPERKQKSYQLLEDNIGYVTLQNIKKADISGIKKDFKDTQGIIIDLRNYPSTFVPYILAPFFTSSDKPFVKFTKMNLNNPGEFSFTATRNNPSLNNPYQGKLVLLVNEYTQSQAEFTAMAFQTANNVTIVGSTTAGADGNVSAIWLPGGLMTRISGIGVYYPNGQETQRIGIVPDIDIKPSIQGIRQGKDEVLEKAINVIKRCP